MSVISNNDKNVFPKELSEKIEDIENVQSLDEEIVVDNWKVKAGDLILRISHLVFGIFRLFTYPIENIFSRRHSTKGLGEYCFTQQYNDSCHLSPLKNLEILEIFRSVGYDLAQMDFHNRREWLGENQEMLIPWFQLMAELCQENAKDEYPEIYNYIHGGLEKGPILPHFYHEDHTIAFHGLQGLIEFSEIPFFLIDFESLQEVRFRVMCMNIDFGEMLSEDDLGIRVSIVKDKGIYKIYNSKTREFEPVQNLDWIEIKKIEDGEEAKRVVKIDREVMTEDDKAHYPLPPEGYEIVMQKFKGLGFSEFGVVNQLGNGFKLKNEKGEIHTYIPYRKSLIKMLLLAAGLDENNEMIDSDHPNYAAQQEFQKLMGRDPNNLWHQNHLNRDKLLQYQLAEIFKDNPDLFRKVKGVIDVAAKNWLNHQKVQNGSFYNAQGEKLEKEGVKAYMLGDEQAVAYYLMKNIRMAWYSAINPKVLINCLEVGLPDHLAPMTHQFFLAKLKAKHRIKLSDGEVVAESFLSVWDEVLASLKERTKDGPQDFMSFDDHGWVVSLDEELIKLQNEGQVYDKSLLKRLGIAGIESWWGSELNLWYKRNRERVEDLTEEKPEEIVDISAIV